MLFSPYYFAQPDITLFYSILPSPSSHLTFEMDFLLLLLLLGVSGILALRDFQQFPPHLLISRSSSSKITLFGHSTEVKVFDAATSSNTDNYRQLATVLFELGVEAVQEHKPRMPEFLFRDPNDTTSTTGDIHLLLSGRFDPSVLSRSLIERIVLEQISLSQIPPPQISFEEVDLEKESLIDYQRQVQKGWKPFLIEQTDVLISMPWHSLDDINQFTFTTNICLEGGAAFGTGEHNTTSLAGRWLIENINDFPSPLRMLDYGTGSGILSFIAANRFKGKPMITGSDILLNSVRTASRNAINNNYSNLCNFKLSTAAAANDDNETTAEFSTIDPTTQKFDLIVANIISPVLISIAAETAQMLEPGGKLLLAGLLSYQFESVAAAYREVGIEIKCVSENANDSQAWILCENVI